MKNSIITAIALLLVGTPVQAQPQPDPERAMAYMFAVVVMFDQKCEKVSPKAARTAKTVFEIIGEVKATAALWRVEEQIKKDGLQAWCSYIHENSGTILFDEDTPKRR
jgi:hypothetical protein